MHLWCATTLDNMVEHPTEAEDRFTEPNIRAARTMGQKVVNGVSGRVEYSVPLMAYANLGHDAHEASDSHVYTFNVSGANEYQIEHAKPQGKERFVWVAGTRTNDVMRRLKKMMGDGDIPGASGGARRYGVTSTDSNGKKDETFMFLTQAQVYAHRPAEFEDYTMDDFEACACVVRCAKINQGHRQEVANEDCRCVACDARCEITTGPENAIAWTIIS